MRKYKLTKEKKEISGTTLYRIEALRDFGDVKKGDKGGFIEKEENLSHEGNCWVYDNACVFDNARVFDDARVYDNACIFDNAWVHGVACIFDNAWVHGDALVYDDALGL